MVDDSAPLLGDDGVTATAGAYTPTDVCDQGIADKLGIPSTYLRRMRIVGLRGLPEPGPVEAGPWSLVAACAPI